MASSWPLITSNPAGLSVSTGATVYCSIMGGLFGEPTQNAESAWMARDGFTVEGLSVRMTSSVGGTSPVVTLMVGGLAGSNVVTCTGAGTFSSSASDSIADGDLVELRVVAGDTEAAVFTNIQTELKNADADNLPYMCRYESLQTQTTGTTRYYPIEGVLSDAASTEVWSQLKLTQSATFTRVRAYYQLNNATANGSVTLTEAGSTTSLTVTITGGAAGAFESADGLDEAVAADALVATEVIAGDGAIRVANISYLAESHAQRRMAVNNGGADIIMVPATNYFPLEGFAALDTTEADQKTNMIAGVLKNIYAYQRTRVGTTNVVLSIRKNGVTTGLTVTIDGDGAQTATDESNTVTVAAGDDIAFIAVTTNATSSRMTQMSVEFDQPAAGGLSIPIAYRYYQTMAGR